MTIFSPDTDSCSSVGIISVAVGLFDLLYRAVTYRRRRRALRAQRPRSMK